MLALIDGDVIKYACGFACQHSVFKDEDGNQITIGQIKGGMRLTNLETKEKQDFPGLRSKAKVLEEIGGDWTEEVVAEPDNHVGYTVKQMILSILRRTGAHGYYIYLSRGDCFRVGVYPEYKANRKDIPKPLHIHTIEEYLLKHHPTLVYEGIEADDAMGIAQYQAILRGEQQTIICSLDKDLQMIPGWHYNWNKQEVFFVSEEEAMFNFWCQTLTGDATDNIPGIDGVGPKTARVILETGLNDGYDYQTIVKGEYLKAGLDDKDFERNATLLWILRKPLEETYGKCYADFFTE